MSLDVCLIIDKSAERQGSGVYVRRDGQTIEITRAEWDEKFPGQEPVVAEAPEENHVHCANITHNLGEMARQASLYYPLWRPGEIGISTAAGLIDPLRRGLGLLKARPDHFKEYNPENGWGTYEGLVRFTEEYLAACEEYPQARVEVSR